MALGVRNLNCAVPEKTSELAPNSTLQGLVRGVRRRFARRARRRRRNGPAGAPEALFQGVQGGGALPGRPQPQECLEGGEARADCDQRAE
eukprot:1032837-Alexandrium_andersonii.AAC.1